MILFSVSCLYFDIPKYKYLDFSERSQEGGGGVGGKGGGVEGGKGEGGWRRLPSPLLNIQARKAKFKLCYLLFKTFSPRNFSPSYN